MKIKTKKLPVNATAAEYQSEKKSIRTGEHDSPSDSLFADDIFGDSGDQEPETATKPASKQAEPAQQAKPQGKSIAVENTSDGSAVLEKLTQSYVARINRIATKEATDWINIGKLVTDYVTAFDKHHFKGDAYKKLADSDNFTIKDKQLRHYARCYDLSQVLGNNAPKLPMTHYIAVLSLKTSVLKQEMLLKEAYAKELSVSELKKLIARVAAPRKKEKAVVDPVVAFQEAASELHSTFLALHHSPLPDNKDKEATEGTDNNEGNEGNEVLPSAPSSPSSHRETVHDAMLPIIQLMVQSGYIRQSECVPPKKTRDDETWNLGGLSKEVVQCK